MIRIAKKNEAPRSLTQSGKWNKDDVNRMLLEDQHSKCYLCERELVTDFQVEHFKSRAHHPELTYEWSNLLCSCFYCNGKKSNAFDNILNPLKSDIEKSIYQWIDSPNPKAIFRIEGLETEEGIETIKLLDSIFNGKGPFKSVKEEKFFDYVKANINSFQGLCLSWLNTRSNELRNAIIEELDITAEFLGFKYWIIRSNPRLLTEFKDYIVWNKRAE